MDRALSIVIITRDTRDLLAGLLESIDADASLRGALLETIVVDNGSRDGTAEMIRERFPAVRCHRREENLGFARAANEGYGLSSGRLVLFLNSDTRLIGGELVKLLSFLDGSGEAGIAGPQLVYDDMTEQRSFANVPSLLTEMVPEALLGFLMPARYGVRGRRVTGPEQVESLIGAAMAVKKEALDGLGGFDERFFFFLEETDLCVRANGLGARVFFFPGASVIHLQGKTVRKDWVGGRIEYSISLHKFIEKHHTTAYARLFTCARTAKCLLSLIFWVFARLPGGDRPTMRYAYYKALFGWYLKGRPEDAGLRPNSRG